MESKFIDLVRQMRENQKEYFRTRHPNYLNESRRLEKQVDAELDMMTSSLFAGADAGENDTIARIREFITSETPIITKLQKDAGKQGEGCTWDFYQGQLSIIQELGKIINQ